MHGYLCKQCIKNASCPVSGPRETQHTKKKKCQSNSLIFQCIQNLKKRLKLIFTGVRIGFQFSCGSHRCAVSLHFWPPPPPRTPRSGRPSGRCCTSRSWWPPATRPQHPPAPSPRAAWRCTSRRVCARASAMGGGAVAQRQRTSWNGRNPVFAGGGYAKCIFCILNIFRIFGTYFAKKCIFLRIFGSYSEGFQGSPTAYFNRSHIFYACFPHLTQSY